MAKKKEVRKPRSIWEGCKKPQVSKEELVEKPIDLQLLTESCISERNNGWYALHIPLADLEDHVRNRIYEMCYDPEHKEIHVKFDRRQRRWASLLPDFKTLYRPAENLFD